MGDEVRRTQFGNNNDYCHDHELSWFDWTLFEKHADIHRFVKPLIARRLLRDMEAERQRKSLSQLLHEAKKAWHSIKLGQPDWSHHSHTLACAAQVPNQNLLLHLILNAYWEPLDFELPPVKEQGGDSWRRWIDTALDCPNDIVEWQNAPLFEGSNYHAEPRSVVLLFSRLQEAPKPG
jgi:isoamylase